MKKAITPLTALPPTGMGSVDIAWDAVSVSFERFCLTAGIEALGTMVEQDAEERCGFRAPASHRPWPPPGDGLSTNSRLMRKLRQRQEKGTWAVALEFL